MSVAAKKLPPLELGDNVLIQNQSGNHLRRWDKRRVVVEVLGFDQYQVRVEGSRRLTLRNRRFLRRFSKQQPIAFVTLPVCERDGVDMEPEPMSATRRAKQVGTLEGRDGHGGVGAVPSQADVPDGVEDVHAKQPLQLVERGAAGHDLRVDMDRGGPPVDQQDGGHAVAVPSEPCEEV